MSSKLFSNSCTLCNILAANAGFLLSMYYFAWHVEICLPRISLGYGPNPWAIAPEAWSG